MLISTPGRTMREVNSAAAATASHQRSVVVGDRYRIEAGGDSGVNDVLRLDLAVLLLLTSPEAGVCTCRSTAQN